MNKTKKVLYWTFSSIGVLYLLIVLFPQCLFANKIEYKNFTVYYHSNEIKTEELKLVLDKSRALLEQTELSKNEGVQKIFICDGFNEFTFFAPLSRKSFAVNYPFLQNIFLSKSSVSDNSIFRNGEENNKRSLSAVIAHETTHSLLENNLGILKYKLLPSWKNEGYCDFIAQESSYDPQKGLKEMYQNKDVTDSPSFYYFKSKIYTEYLLKEKNLTLEAFLNNDFDLKNIHLEFIQRKNAK